MELPFQKMSEMPIVFNNLGKNILNGQQPNNEWN